MLRLPATLLALALAPCYSGPSFADPACAGAEPKTVRSDDDTPRRRLGRNPHEIEDEDAAGGFGFALAEVGDWDRDGISDVACSAPHIGEDRPGVVRVVSGARGTLLMELTGEEPGDEFGYALAGGIDYDRDGVGDLAIGVRSASAGGAKRGTVRIVSGKRRRLLSARIDGPEDYGFTGAALCSLPDQNADGWPELVVASPGESQARGIVRVHSGADLKVSITLRGRGAEDAFGTSLDRAGDMDGDGRVDLVVGSPNEAPHNPEHGTTRVFDARTGRVLRSVVGDVRFGRLGTRVCGLGDVTGDGRAEFAAAAPTRELAGAPDVGRVHVYDGETGATLYTLDGDGAGAFFGRSLAGGRDVDGDGWPDLVVGSPYSTSSRIKGRRGRLRGAVTVYSGPTGEPIQRVEGLSEGALGGWAVAVLGTGDDASAIAVGAPGRQETAPAPDDPDPRAGMLLLFEVD